MSQKETYYEKNNVDRPNTKTSGIPAMEEFSYERLIWFENLKIGDYIDVIKGDISDDEIK